MTTESMTTGLSGRRAFLKTTALVAGAVAAGGFPAVARAGTAVLPIRIGLVGCGRRGMGALLNALAAAPDVAVVAIADLFSDQVATARAALQEKGIPVAADRCFSGWNAYREIVGLAEVNYVILATPPHFRAAHLQAAIEAGKHVYAEKPAGVDATGVRAVLAAAELARTKGLAIGAGTQRRHWWPYQETVRRLQDGAIGEIVAARCCWNAAGMWRRDREPGWSDVEWQIRNWLYFTWLSGDHIVEQHVHNLDVINWVKNAHPVSARGMGGRQVRTGPEFGHIYDHFNVEFEYADGMRLHSECRQIDGCTGAVAEAVVGTKGTSNCADRYALRDGSRWRYEIKAPVPYVRAHTDVIESIRAGAPLNEGRELAESTLTAIMGRLAAYSGQAVTWEMAMSSQERLGPVVYAFGALPVPEVAMPGKFKVL